MLTGVARTMTLSRRRLMHLSAAGVATLAIGARPQSAQASATDEIQNHARAHFGKRGHVPVPPLGMITGQTFNDGLRYDESRMQYPQQNWCSIQYAARVEDIDKRDQPGVLAGFHFIAMGYPAPAAPGTLLTAVLEYLIDVRKLDPDRVLIVSTEMFEPHRERAARHGAKHVLQRSLAEAKAAGDGSGYFAPKGHPVHPSFATASIYYALPGRTPPLPTSYPPLGYIEIAEVPITMGNGQQGETGNAGIGLERLAMAEGKQAPDFQQSRRALLQAIADEAKQTGQTLPPGHARFAKQ
jgi:hypothetical protein